MKVSISYKIIEMNKKNFFTFLAFIFFLMNVQGQTFSREAVLQDLDHLRSSLENAHYNLYAFTSKTEFEENFRRVRNSVVEDSLSLKEATGLFQKVIAKANTGHAEIDFPAQAYISYAMNGGTIFPLELAFEDDKVYIRKNFSDNSKINTGSELLSINDEPIKEILEKIYPQLSAERKYFKNAKLEFWSFPRLYWQIFGEQKEFRVELKNEEGTAVHQVSAIEALEGYEYKRKDVFDFPAKLEFFGNTAYLYPGAFSSQQEEGEEIFKSFIDSAFAEIRNKAVENLIVDLRYNSGGHDAFSNYLIAHFADEPFRWNSDFSLKTSEFLKAHTRKNNDTTAAYFKAILEHRDGEKYAYDTGAYAPVPLEKRFTGKVFTLVNRQTHSMAAVAAALIQDYGFATIVGEETGEFPSLHASQFSYQLPNTGVLVKVPKGFITRPNGKIEQRGVMPDILIKDHLLDEEDEILKGILHQIGNGS